MVMKLRIPAPTWEVRGNEDRSAPCRKFLPTAEHDDFFGDGTGEMEQAKHVCNGTYTGRVCPLREQCLTFALVNNEHYGCWGGLYPLERAYIRRFVPKDEWSFENAPTREDLEREWPDRIPATFWDGDDLGEDEYEEDEALGSDGGSGGDEEGE